MLRSQGRLPTAIGLVLMLAGASSLGAAAAEPSLGVSNASRVSVTAAQAGGGSRDPLRLFSAMMPVFSSPRCVNCHGGVNVHTGDGHEAGEIDVDLDSTGDMRPGAQGNQICLNCHDEGASVATNDDGTAATNPDGTTTLNGPWRLAPGVMSFVGKDALTLCKQMRETNALTEEDPIAFAAFIRHLSTDPLIGFAFEGLRGITPSSPEGPVTAEKPPMDRPTFVQLAQRWLSEGKAKCTPWKGTITQTTTKNLKTPLTEDVTDSTVTITLKDNGDQTAHLHMAGHLYQTGQGCFSARDTYAVDADATPEVSILVSRDLNSIPGFTPPAAPSLPAGVSLPPNVPAPPNLLGGDTYTIVFTVPSVTGSDHQEQRTEPGCRLSTSDHSFPFTAAGGTLAKPLDPKQPDHLKDSDTTTQGPAKVTTAWDLTRD